VSEVQVQLERLAPLPDGGLQDWPDVLRRAGYRRHRGRVLVVLVVATLAGGLLAATPALGLRAELFGDEPAPNWTWPEGVPGEPVQAPGMLVQMNATASRRLGDRVDLGTIRRIVSTGRGEGRSDFYAARGLDGDVCLTKLSANGHAGFPFSCLHDPARPGVQPVDERAVMIGMSAGGHRGSVVDYASLIGVARADVGRVELELADGETVELPLNRWRGFGYYATDPKRFPKTLSVYATWSSFFRKHEKLVGQLPVQQIGGLQPTPLCGGAYGPCPTGVKP
jgi:hypothetical protein